MPERPVFPPKTRVKISHSNPTLKQAPPSLPFLCLAQKSCSIIFFLPRKKNNPPPSPSVCRAGRRGEKSRSKLQKVFFEKCHTRTKVSPFRESKFSEGPPQFRNSPIPYETQYLVMRAGPLLFTKSLSPPLTVKSIPPPLSQGGGDKKRKA